MVRISIARRGIELIDAQNREVIMNIGYKFLANYENEDENFNLTIHCSEQDVGVGQNTETYAFQSIHVILLSSFNFD